MLRPNPWRWRKISNKEKLFHLLSEMRATCHFNTLSKFCESVCNDSMMVIQIRSVIDQSSRGKAYTVHMTERILDNVLKMATQVCNSTLCLYKCTELSCVSSVSLHWNCIFSVSFSLCFSTFTVFVHCEKVKQTNKKLLIDSWKEIQWTAVELSCSTGWSSTIYNSSINYKNFSLLFMFTSNIFSSKAQ